MLTSTLLPIYVAATLISSNLHQEPMNFDQAFERAMEFEGGGVVHTVEGDPGGTTKWGISQRAFPALNIALLTKEQAKDIYREEYWNAIQGDDLPPEIRGHVFDSAVNQGVSRAITLLQQSVNMYALILDRNRVIQDGVLGPQTLTATRSYRPERLTTLFRHYRARHYVNLAAYRGRGKFLFGWLSRV